MSIEKIGLLYTTHQYKSINYKVAAVDSDYLGWKYEEPVNCNKIVLLNNFINMTNIVGMSEYGEDKTIELCDPVFHITVWDHLYSSPIFVHYFQTCLFFNDISSEMITECVKDYIINVCQQSNEAEILDYGESLQQVFMTMRKIDYKRPVMFDRGLGLIRNFNMFTEDNDVEIINDDNIKISI